MFVSENENPDVTVIGAGPVGLLLAVGAVPHPQPAPAPIGLDADQCA